MQRTPHQNCVKIRRNAARVTTTVIFNDFFIFHVASPTALLLHYEIRGSTVFTAAV